MIKPKDVSSITVKDVINKKISAVLIVIVVILGACAMVKQDSKNILSPFEIEDALSIISVKLIETDEGLQLCWSTIPSDKGTLGYRTTVSSTAIAETSRTTSELFVIPQLLPPPPDWDITWNSKGSYSVVFENAGGAVNSLSITNTNLPDVPVTTKYPFESFSKPRFVKRYRDAHGRLSISTVSDNKHIVGFWATPEGFYESYMTMCDCEDGIIIKYQEGFVVVYKSYIPGPVRGSSIPQGVLHYIMMGMDLKQIGSAIQPLGNTTIFEFDVEVIADNIAVFATTEDGSILTIGKASADAFETVSRIEDHSGLMFTSPSILATKSHLQIVVLDSAQTDKAKILIGGLPIDKFH